MIKKVIKYLLNKFNSKPIFNYFDTDFEENVLISYITKPFRDGIDVSHSNRVEALSIAKIFNNLGYNVDVYDFSCKKKVDFEKYKVIFGIGNLFEFSLVEKNKNCRYIYYATGAYFEFQNTAEMSRLIELYKRRGVLLNPVRLVDTPRYLATQLSDAIITTGNDWTISTYTYSKMPFYKVPVSVYSTVDEKLNREISSAKKKFIWLGSYGLVHKGLDLCIEVFKDLPDFELHIFGNQEKDFLKIYESELTRPNIIFHGFIDITGEKFKRISESCLFSVFPSCSEGQSGSLLTTMDSGLIPLATEASGVDLNDKGFVLEESIDNIKKVVLQVVNIEDSELEKLSINCMDYIEKNHRIASFEEEFEKSLKIILNNNGRKD